jgi:ubiquinone/menaquinone biosynthesis C-methylase UbiE
MPNSLFDFGAVAEEYDAYYDTPVGQRIDQVEQRLVARHLAQLDTGHLLEIGCGTGHWTEYFAGRGFTITALDVSAPMLAVARGKRIRGAVFEYGDARALGCDDGSQERVAAITSLEFVPDREDALAEIQRVLRPGGWLLIGCLNAASALGRSKDQSDIYRDAQFFTPEGLKQVLARFGAPRVDGCVVMEDDSVLDLAAGFDPDIARRQGAFLVGSVRRQ